MRGENKSQCFRRFRSGFILGMVFSLLLCIFVIYNKKKILAVWQQTQGRVEVAYDGIQTKLDDGEKCYLCGKSDRSLIGYYRKFDSIGLISINDWYVIELGFKASSLNSDDNVGNLSTFTRQGDMLYSADSSPSRGMASLEVDLPDNYNVDTTLIEDNLCQDCLDKVTESLSYSKWRYEKKKPIPLCIVDFQTLEIYSLQDWHRGFSVRDYWVNLFFLDNKVEINAYDLPKR